MTIPKTLKLVSVEWVDSRQYGAGWEFADDIESSPPSQCITVGFILEQTRKYITIAQTVGDGQVLGRITIPASAIVKQRNLK